MEHVIETQRKVTLKLWERKQTKLYSILIIVDDFADEANFTRHSKLLHSLFTRGRHSAASTVVASQKINAISQIIRVNATALVIFSLRNQKDLDSYLEENGALVDKKTLLDIYHMGTAEPYSFLYLDLTATKINDIFHIGFNKKILISEE